MHYYEKKSANNKVTYDVPNYLNSFNVFECGRNVLDRLNVSYKRAFMATPKEEYFTEMLDHLNKHNRCRSKPLSSKKLLEAVIRVMEEEELYYKRNVNNVTTDT